MRKRPQGDGGEVEAGEWFNKLPEFVVLEDEPEPTGLLDRHGRPLLRQREPIGFRFSENE